MSNEVDAIKPPERDTQVQSEPTLATETAEVDTNLADSVDRPVDSEQPQPMSEPPSDQATSTASDSKRWDVDGPSLDGLAARIEELARLLEETNRLSAERERIVDRLHAENQSLRLGELQQAQVPVFRDLIRLFDDLQQTIQMYAGMSNVTPAAVLRDLECYREAVCDILYRQSVDRYDASEGTPFDAKQHRALGAVPTAEPATDRTIARVVRAGFRNDARIVRPLEAEVYRYSPKTEPVSSQ